MSTIPHTGSSPRRNPITGWFAKRTVSTKILMALCTVVAVMVGLGLSALSKMAVLDALSRDAYASNVVPLQQLATLEEAVDHVRLAVRGHLLAPDDEAITADEETIASQGTVATELLRRYTAGATRDERGEIAAFGPAWGGYMELVEDRILPLSRAGRKEEANSLVRGEGERLAHQAIEPLTRLIQGEVTDAKEAVDTSTATFVAERRTILITLVAGVLLALALALVVARTISGPLKRMVNVLRAITDGDLTTEMDARSRDEVGRMGSALNQTVHNFRGAISAIGHNAQVLASSSEELDAVSQQMAGNAEETSAQAGVVSAAAEQVSANVQTVAAGADRCPPRSGRSPCPPTTRPGSPRRA